MDDELTTPHAEDRGANNHAARNHGKDHLPGSDDPAHRDPAHEDVAHEDVTKQGDAPSVAPKPRSRRSFLMGAAGGLAALVAAACGRERPTPTPSPLPTVTPSPTATQVGQSSLLPPPRGAYQYSHATNGRR